MNTSTITCTYIHTYISSAGSEMGNDQGLPPGMSQFSISPTYNAWWLPLSEYVQSSKGSGTLIKLIQRIKSHVRIKGIPH